MKFRNIQTITSVLIIFSTVLFTIFSIHTKAAAVQIDGVSDAELKKLVDEYVPKYDANSLPNLFMNIVPENPGPEETATISLTSYMTKLDTSDITWLINGVIVKHGVGDKKLTFTTGKVGTRSDIVVIVKSKFGLPVRGELVIRPASLDILWEAQSSVPPFYRGKALPSDGSSIKVVALPGFIDESGVRIDPKNLVYKWTHGATVLGDDSGYGKDSIVVNLNDLNIRNSLSVLVTSTDGSIRASKTVLVPSYNPKVVLYEQHPLYGLRLEHGITNTYNLLNTEIAVTAIPYFFNTDDIRSGDVSFNWKVNGAFAASGPTQNFRQGAGSGVSIIEILLNNKKQRFQNTADRVELRFNSGPASSGF